ncbi:ead/Ea22-like family protein [Klebsiella pneumoniae]|nr:ead/Ea22-like family protein [Klebsiella pneumoniae]
MTTDITELAQRMKAAAEKATPGEWVYFPKNTSIEYDVGSDESQGSILYVDSGDFTQVQTDRNGEFIALANPANILALVEALEYYKSREERVTSLVRDNSKSWDELYRQVEAKGKRNVELVEALESEKRICATWRKTAEANSEKLEKAQQQTTESENRVRKQNRHICELFDDNTALRQRIAELESRTVKLPAELYTIGELIRTQDNRITDQPMFVVFQKREIIGSDEHSPSRICWVWDGEEVSELRAKRLEALYQDGRDTRGYDRYAMQEVDEFVTACFTEHGCKDYLHQNGHNLRLPYIYACGSFRNNEYQLVRNWLAGIKVEGE